MLKLQTQKASDSERWALLSFNAVCTCSGRDVDEQAFVLQLCHLQREEASLQVAEFPRGRSWSGALGNSGLEGEAGWRGQLRC